MFLVLLFGFFIPWVFSLRLPNCQSLSGHLVQFARWSDASMPAALQLVQEGVVCALLLSVCIESVPVGCDVLQW